MSILTIFKNLKLLNFFEMKKIYSYAALLAATILFLANSGNPPLGYTGSPDDGVTCGSCHSGGNFAGNLQINGVPATISPGTVYPLSVVVTKTTGSPSRAGFQLKSEVSSANVGTFTAGTSNATNGGYIYHNGAVSFGGGSTVTYNFNWTSPTTFTNGAAINFYAASVIGNGSGTGGDQVVTKTASGTFQGAVSTPLTVTTSNVTNVSCNGGSNGAATVSASGGSGCSYTYAWSNGQSGATISNLSAGTYTVTATCGASTGTTSVAISQPSVLSFSSTSSQSINCNGTGSVSAIAAGGSPSYTYAWSNGLSGSTVTVTSAGTYLVTATDSKGCTKTTSVSVGTNINPPTANVVASGNLSCTNSSVTLANSTTPSNYTYKWQSQAGGPVSTGTVYTVTQAGAYNLTVTDTNTGCTAVTSKNVTSNNTPPNIVISNTNPTISCTTPMVVLNASGTTGTSTPLSFNWTGTGIVGGNLNANVTVNKVGTYNLIVTDNGNGCTATQSVSVFGNTSPPSVSVSATTTPVLTCEQTAVNLTTIASPNNVVYAWSNNAGNVNSITTNVAGNYTVTVTNPSNGCTSTSTINITEDKTPPIANAGQDKILNCANPSVTIGGASSTGANFTYLWSNNIATATQVVGAAGNFTITVTNTINGCSNTDEVAVTADNSVPTATIAVPATLTCATTTTGLDGTGSSTGANFTYSWQGAGIVSGSTTLTPTINSPGTYSLSVTNTTTGCVATKTVNVLQDITIPVIDITGAPVICEGTVAILTATPNKGIYLWNNGNATNQLITNQPGTYSVTVAANNGCTTTATKVVIASPKPNVKVSDIKACEGTDITFDAVVTNAPNATYEWSASVGNVSAATPKLPIAKVTPVNNGNYYVLVINQDGCVGKDTATLTVSPKMSVTTTAKVGCDSMATVTAVVAGGTPTLNYKWSGSNVITNPLLIKAPATTTLTVTDGFGCTATSSALNIAAPTPISISGVAINQTNATKKDGKITASATGGVAPYSYTWDNGAKTPIIEGLAAGKYCVTVTDANNCQKTNCFTINDLKVGVADETLAESIAVFPNPTNNILTIENNKNIPFSKILLLDSRGSVVEDIDTKTNTIDLSSLPEGLYVLYFKTQSAFVIKEILKIK
jgi:Secretion system C-terminal sorting domain/SprB repeat